MARSSTFLSTVVLLLGSAGGFRRAERSDKVACSDVNTGCASWAEQGFCAESSQYHAWMVVNCCTSCSSVPAPAPSGRCRFTKQPREVSNSVGSGYRSFIYTEPYRADLWVDGLLLRDAAYEQYAQWLTTTMARNFADVDPYDQRALLRRQRDVFAKHGFDTWEWDVILNGRVGAITAANCIESALWAKQNELHPLSGDESEFGAYILVDNANTTVKVYLQTGPSASVPHMSWATQPITQDLNNGYKMLTFLHNHPFFADQPRGVDCAGTCVPSSPDLRSFASGINRNAESFWITNGHDSFRFPSSELGLFTPPTPMEALGARSIQKSEHPEGPLDLLLGDKREHPEGPLDLLLGAKK